MPAVVAVLRREDDGTEEAFESDVGPGILDVNAGNTPVGNCLIVAVVVTSNTPSDVVSRSIFNLDAIAAAYKGSNIDKSSARQKIWIGSAIFVP